MLEPPSHALQEPGVGPVAPEAPALRLINWLVGGGPLETSFSFQTGKLSPREGKGLV